MWFWKRHTEPAMPIVTPAGYPADIKSYYSPVDDVHGAILAAIKSAKRSLLVGMYGLDDEDLVAAILKKMRDENVYVQLTLDKSQASGVHERQLLATANFPANTVAIGESEKHAIMHLKVLVVDGIRLVTGSTNWSASGETKQDNVAIIIDNPYIAAEASSRLSVIHANMLQQMAR
jgi:phosphatidylserine/phosphatidylglycerophosphate/cardiolipin synthase-like enzyme